MDIDTKKAKAKPKASLEDEAIKLELAQAKAAKRKERDDLLNKLSDLQVKLKEANLSFVIDKIRKQIADTKKQLAKK